MAETKLRRDAESVGMTQMLANACCGEDGNLRIGDAIRKRTEGEGKKRKPEATLRFCYWSLHSV